jgi:hypothetical protein
MDGPLPYRKLAEVRRADRLANPNRSLQVAKTPRNRGPQTRKKAIPTQRPILTGPTDEWHLLEHNSFCHLGFEHVARGGHEVVLLLSAFESSGFEAAGSVAHAVRGDGVE